MTTKSTNYVLLLCLLALGSSLGARANVIPYTEDITPSERHQRLGESKIKASERSLMSITPASVMDVSGYDQTYYEINLEINEITQWVYGEVTMHAVGRVDSYDSPTINLHSEMTVDSVKQAGQPVVWSRSANYIFVTLNATVDTDEAFEVTIWYQGHPTTGGFQGFSFSSYAGIPVISTLSEPYMAQSWWPCKDTPSDKADSVDLNITVNSNFYVVSNGVLRDSVDNGNSTTTYSWHEGYPVTTYLISLAISEYTRFDHWYHYGPGDMDSTPVRFYSYPSKAATAQTAWPIAVDQMDFFADVWGEYPFVEEKYGMAHFNWGGAMEHQTATSATYTSFGFDQYLIAHELAHQWWGDMITCRNWHHIWLNEGFASYAEALWAEDQYGEVAYRNYMAGMAYYSGGRIYIDDTTSVSNIFSSRVYDKGAWVLHMLRGIVGDSDFFTILQQYYSSPLHQHKDAVTEDFQTICESVSGLDLNVFFQNWIYGYYYPGYAYSWKPVPRTSDNFFDVHVHIRQYQTSSPQVFTMPIEIQLNGVSGTPVHRVWNDQRAQNFVFVSPSIPTSITFDPKTWVLSTKGSELYTMHLVNDDLKSGTELTTYADTIEIVGGTPPYTIQVTSGALPNGVVLDTQTGVLSGMPTVGGAYPLTIDVWDNGSAYHDQVNLTLDIAVLGYQPGDMDGNLTLDAVDLNALIDYLFFGGVPAISPNTADVNGDCIADASDLNLLIDVLFFGATDLVAGCIE